MCKLTLNVTFIMSVITLIIVSAIPRAASGADIHHQFYSSIILSVAAIKFTDDLLDDFEGVETEAEDDDPASEDEPDVITEDDEPEDDPVEVDDLGDNEPEVDELEADDLEDDELGDDDIGDDDLGDDDIGDDDVGDNDLGDDDIGDDDDGDDDLGDDDIGDDDDGDDDLEGKESQNDDERNGIVAKKFDNNDRTKNRNNGKKKEKNRSGGGGSYGDPPTSDGVIAKKDRFRDSTQLLDDDEEIDEDGFLVGRGQLLAIDMDENTIELVRESGFTVERKRTLDNLGFSVVSLRVPSGMEITEALKALQQEDPDTFYDYNHIYSLSDDQQVAQLEKTLSGTSIESFRGNIGLIDTDIDQRHPALSGATIKTKDFSNRNNRPSQHGTAIASQLIANNASRVRGLLPNATLYSANVFYNTSSGKLNATAESLALALNWLMQNKVTVINMSLAGPPNELLRLSVERALEKNHIIVAAVGNDGPAAPPAFPSAYPGVVAVTAVDSSGRIYRRANRGQHVDFSAIGVSVLAATPGKDYKTYTGTSFASPTIAAIIAASVSELKSQDTSINLKKLQAAAIDMGNKGFDPIFGHGLLNTNIAAEIRQ